MGCNAKRMVRLTFLKKVCILIGIIDLFAHTILKNIEIISNQGVVESQPNWCPRLPVKFGL